MKRRPPKQQQQQLAELGCPYADAIAGAKALSEVPEDAWKKALLWLCAKIDPGHCKSQEDLPSFLASFGVSPPVSNFIGRASGADLSANFELLVQGARAASATAPSGKKGLAKRFDDSCSLMGYVIQNREKLFPATLKRMRSDGTDGEVIPLQTFNPNKRHKSLIKLNSELVSKIQKVEKDVEVSEDAEGIERLSFEEIRDPFQGEQDGDEPVEVTFDIQDYKSIIDRIECASAIHDALKEIK